MEIEFLHWEFICIVYNNKPINIDFQFSTVRYCNIYLSPIRVFNLLYQTFPEEMQIIIIDVCHDVYDAYNLKCRICYFGDRKIDRRQFSTII